MKQLITTLQGIQKHDEKFTGIFKKPGFRRHSLRPGSITKLKKEALLRFGIDVSQLSSDDREALRRLAENYHKIDLDDQEQQPRIDGFVQTPWRQDRKKEMCQYAGATVKELLKSQKRKERITIAEIPARRIPASFSVAVAMWNDDDTREDFERTTFHLVNYDASKMNHALKQMQRYMVSDIESHWKQTDTDFLKNQPDGSIDIIISLMHLHRKPFLSDYLMDLHRVLSDDGILIIGDWHSTLFDHPVNLCDFLLGTMNAQNEVDEVRRLLGSELMRPDINVKLTPEETKANETHRRYLNEVYKEIQAANLGLPPRIHIFGAYRTSIDQMEELQFCGFDTDIAVIRRNNPESNLVDSPVKLLVDPADQKLTDFAVFMIAQKKQDGGI
jgi:hypothetical protein